VAHKTALILEQLYSHKQDSYMYDSSVFGC
jgi:hypothetical protein